MPSSDTDMVHIHACRQIIHTRKKKKFKENLKDWNETHAHAHAHHKKT